MCQLVYLYLVEHILQWIDFYLYSQGQALNGLAMDTDHDAVRSPTEKMETT